MVSSHASATHLSQPVRGSAEDANAKRRLSDAISRRTTSVPVAAMFGRAGIHRETDASEAEADRSRGDVSAYASTAEGVDLHRRYSEARGGPGLGAPADSGLHVRGLQRRDGEFTSPPARTLLRDPISPCEKETSGAWSRRAAGSVSRIRTSTSLQISAEARLRRCLRVGFVGGMAQAPTGFRWLPHDTL